jgi:hypothetical protein
MIGRSATTRAVASALAVLLAGLGGALGHGASEGLHLHLSPDPARPGETIKVSVDGAHALRLAVVGIVDGRWAEAEPERPARHLELTLVVPEDAAGASLSVHAEAETEEGAVVRASAILRLASSRRP